MSLTKWRLARILVTSTILIWYLGWAFQATWQALYENISTPENISIEETEQVKNTDNFLSSIFSVSQIYADDLDNWDLVNYLQKKVDKAISEIEAWNSSYKKTYKNFWTLIDKKLTTQKIKQLNLAKKISIIKEKFWNNAKYKSIMPVLDYLMYKSELKLALSWEDTYIHLQDSEKVINEEVTVSNSNIDVNKFSMYSDDQKKIIENTIKTQDLWTYEKWLWKDLVTLDKDWYITSVNWEKIKNKDRIDYFSNETQKYLTSDQENDIKEFLYSKVKINSSNIDSFMENIKKGSNSRFIYSKIKKEKNLEIIVPFWFLSREIGRSGSLWVPGSLTPIDFSKYSEFSRLLTDIKNNKFSENGKLVSDKIDALVWGYSVDKFSNEMLDMLIKDSNWLMKKSDWEYREGLLIYKPSSIWGNYDTLIKIDLKRKVREFINTAFKINEDIKIKKFLLDTKGIDRGGRYPLELGKSIASEKDWTAFDSNNLFNYLYNRY